MDAYWLNFWRLEKADCEVIQNQENARCVYKCIFGYGCIKYCISGSENLPPIDLEFPISKNLKFQSLFSQTCKLEGKNKHNKQIDELLE